MRFHIPYRTRQFLQRTAIVLRVLLLIAAVPLLCWFIWLKRFVVYTRDQGAVLDMQMSAHIPEGKPALPPAKKEPISIYYNEGDNAINTSKDLTQIIGYYANTKALEAGIDKVLAQTKTLEPGTPVMLDVKSGKGNFFYSSSVADHRHKKIDPTAMDELIRELDQRGMYLIARLPAFRDYQYGLIHDEDGLFVQSGRYLWADSGYCYWLNPTRQGTLAYLIQIVSELRSLGFDEVVFDEFRFPDTDNIKFTKDKTAAITSAAKTLVNTCTTDTFAVSFIGTSPAFPLPEGRSRLYLTNATAADAANLAQQTGLENPDVRLVFLTENHDTRFEAFGVLRPLAAAH